jgi:hypothetical protein
MINSIPGFFLSGENFNEALKLRKMLEERMEHECRGVDYSRQACAKRRRRAAVQTVQDWIWESNLPPRGVSRAGGGGPTRVVGFKEIRWQEHDVRFIQEVCPCSRFIINVRKNISEQRESAMYASRPDLLRARIRQVERIKEAIIIPSSRAVLIAMEDISVASINSLVGWLGERCRFERVAHANRNSTFIPAERVRCSATDR